CRERLGRAPGRRVARLCRSRRRSRACPAEASSRGRRGRRARGMRARRAATGKTTWRHPMVGADPAGRWLPHATTRWGGLIPGVDPRCADASAPFPKGQKKRETGGFPAQSGLSRRTMLWQPQGSLLHDLMQYLTLLLQPVVLFELLQTVALLLATDVPRLAPGVVEQRRLPGPVGRVGQHPPAFAEAVLVRVQQRSAGSRGIGDDFDEIAKLVAELHQHAVVAPRQAA